MIDFPDSTAERDQRRRSIRREIMKQAEKQAATSGKSFNCGLNNHRRRHPEFGWVGCANTGTSCLCECHDGQRAAESAA